MEKVILVDKQDNVLGEMEKMEAHYKGELHRAFSVMIFNDKNQLLLQQRAKEKYHSGGLWTNACCSHPRMGEDILDAGKRRLQEELGFSVELTHQFHFIYRAELDHDMIEHELDHVMFGHYNEISDFNTDEVMDLKYVDISELEKDMQENPHMYTEWFKIIFNKTKEQVLDLA